MSAKARNVLLVAALALAAAALPALALAKRGADDPRGDDRGGRVARGDNDRSGRSGGRNDDLRASRRGGRDDERRVAGRCTGNATSKLKVELDDGRLEVELEVDQNRRGVTWRVTIFRNGRRVVRTRATTRGRSGSFSVERKIANPPGRDRISARAVSPGGQVCTAALRF